MKKTKKLKPTKMYAFYDLLLFLIIDVPIFIFISIYDIMWIFGRIKISDYIYILSCMNTTFLFITAGFQIYSRQLHNYSHSYLEFYSAIIKYGSKKKEISIKRRENQIVAFKDVESVQIVKLTEEQKKDKFFIKHLFNKYLKVVTNTGEIKYIYIGCFSKKQINKILLLITREFNK